MAENILITYNEVCRDESTVKVVQETMLARSNNKTSYGSRRCVDLPQGAA
jgi:hypothetical protein